MIKTDNTQSFLALMEGSKQDRVNFATQIINELEDGLVDPLRVMVQIKSMEQLVDMLTNQDATKNKPAAHLAQRLRSLILDAAGKQPGKEFSLYGAVMAEKEAGTKYDYSKCGVQELIDAYFELANMKEKIKLMEDRLKLVPAGGQTIVNEETGEATRIFPPSKTSTTTLFVSLK